LHHIHPPIPCLYILNLPLEPTTKQDLFYPPVLQFCKKKKWHFCLFKIAIQGVDLWHFHVFMYYNSNWFISYVFLLLL
jgi:hypothetical protein